MGEEYGETAPFPFFVDHGDPELIQAVREGRQREFSGSDWTDDVADPADPETFRRAVLDPSLAQREPHRSRLALTTELLRLRRQHGALTDPSANQQVSMVDDMMFVVRSTPEVTATLMFNFSGDGADVPDPGSADEVVLDTSDERWGGRGWSPDRMEPWSARLVVGRAR